MGRPWGLGSSGCRAAGAICEARCAPGSAFLIFINPFQGQCTRGMVAGTPPPPPAPCRVPRGTRFTRSVAGQSPWRQPRRKGRLRPGEGQSSAEATQGLTSPLIPGGPQGLEVPGDLTAASGPPWPRTLREVGKVSVSPGEGLWSWNACVTGPLDRGSCGNEQRTVPRDATTHRPSSAA